MSVSNGQVADADTFNNAFASKSLDNELTGLLGLSNTAVPASGDAIVNVQRVLNLLFTLAGLTGETDGTGLTYTSTTVVAVSDAYKVAISKLDEAVADILDNATLGFVSFVLANNTGPADVTGVIFDSATVKTFKLDYYVYRETTGGGANAKAQRGELLGAWNGTAWEMVDGAFTPTDCGVAFSVDTVTGQVQYTSDNQAGTYDANLSYFNYRIVDQGV